MSLLQRFVTIRRTGGPSGSASRGGISILAALTATSLMFVGDPPPVRAQTGTISGMVRFESAYPKPIRMRVTKDNETCGGIKLSERFLVSPETRGLQNVLVRIKGLQGNASAKPSAEVTVAQKECMYVPHFQAVVAGADGITLKILNNDGIFHNVHGYRGNSKETLFNFAQTPETPTIEQRIEEPGVIRFQCDVHPWMTAYVVILGGSPYYAVTDSEGRFTIEGVPAGTYTLTAWHEALGEMTKEVVVTAGQTTSTEFLIRPKSGRKKGD